jgi:hypothetical protein
VGLEKEGKKGREAQNNIPILNVGRYRRKKVVIDS